MNGRADRDGRHDSKTQNMILMRADANKPKTLITGEQKVRALTNSIIVSRLSPGC